jgi:type III restriction enzyme
MLYEELDAVEKTYLGLGYFSRLADNHKFVLDNLSDKVQLRDYQKEAFGRYCFYLEEHKTKRLPIHLLFNMATGSGKTVIMAAIILDLYTKGYRNFIFFTRLGNIVEKTKLNFLYSESNKYLFGQSLSHDGTSIQVNQVDSFEGTSTNDINIMFMTTADLHYKLNNPTENSISFEDMESKKVVLIADEAHNLTAETLKKLTAEEELNLASWEGTVMRLLHTNPSENILLEFTATARLDKDYPEVLEKYKDKAIYKYDLKQYRLDGYSKDVNTLEVDAPLMERVLVSIIISQYRLKVAEHFGLTIKPVVMFKSNRVTVPSQQGKSSKPDEAVVVSGLFKADFHKYIEGLGEEDIAKVSKMKNEVLNRAYGFFEAQGISFAQIARELKNDFKEFNCLTVDDGETFESKQRLLNTLEDPQNHIRAVFATQKLNEGWDVLNLFDIVRLYNSRDADNNRAGKTTVEEAQLIGRGARYFPFDYGVGNERMKRKFDSDLQNEMRILEELHYHSKTNPRYIQELRSVLTEQGIIAERSVTRSISVKDDFRKTNFWLTGNLYVNQREKVLSEDILTLRDAQISFDESATANIFTLPTRAIRETEMFTGRSTTLATQAPEVRQVSLKSLGKHVIRTALWDVKNGNFRSLKNVFGSLESLTSFITDEELLGGVKVSVSGTATQLENLSQEEKRQIARFVVEKVLAQANREEFQFRGSRSFKPMPVKEVFGGVKELKLEEGSERTRPVSEYELYLESWFAQNEIWGTSEEKQFLNFLRNSITELDAHFKDIILFRNEKHFPLYAFESGDAFFPDFVLFMKSKQGGNQLGYQIFIEPKGDQFLDENREFGHSGEGWKQKFLMQISDESKLVIDGEHHRLIGLPFFNAGNTNPQLRSKFNDAFKSLFSL